jgi:hypothetical protein
MKPIEEKKENKEDNILNNDLLSKDLSDSVEQGIHHNISSVESLGNTQDTEIDDVLKPTVNIINITNDTYEGSPEKKIKISQEKENKIFLTKPTDETQLTHIKKNNIPKSVPIRKKLMFQFEGNEHTLQAKNIRELYYTINIENLASVLENGLLSRKRAKRLNLIKKDISNHEIQGLRERKIIERVDENKKDKPRKIHRHVNLHLNPHNGMMIRNLFTQKMNPDDLCIVCIHSKILDRGDIVITNKNATVGSKHNPENKAKFFTVKRFALDKKETDHLVNPTAKGCSWDETKEYRQKFIEQYKQEHKEYLDSAPKQIKQMFEKIFIETPTLYAKKKIDEFFLAINKEASKINDETQRNDCLQKIDYFKENKDTLMHDQETSKREDRQAEVLAPYSIDKSYIIGIFTNSSTSKNKVDAILKGFHEKNECTELVVKTNPELFFSNSQYGELTYAPIRTDNKNYQFKEELPESSDSEEDKKETVIELTRN